MRTAPVQRITVVPAVVVHHDHTGHHPVQDHQAAVTVVAVHHPEVQGRIQVVVPVLREVRALIHQEALVVQGVQVVFQEALAAVAGPVEEDNHIGLSEKYLLIKN